MLCPPNDRLYFHQMAFRTQDNLITSERGFPDHKSGLNWHQKVPQTLYFLLRWGGGGEQLLQWQSTFFPQMVATQVFWAHNGVSRSHSRFLTTKVAEICQKSTIIQNLALFALTGSPAAVTSVINHSFFIKWSQIRFLGLKMVSLDHKVAP